MTFHRFLICLVALLIIFALISSAVFILLEANHECLEECCLICDRIATCLHLLGNGITIFVLVLLFRVSCCYLPQIPYCSTTVTSLSNPIALKVKLSD
ncbi:MAG: hypothetical protein MJ102_04785 [Clostridia bacterium]|nr:hypothetical protein [Clostridia bacterium]